MPRPSRSHWARLTIALRVVAALLLADVSYNWGLLPQRVAHSGWVLGFVVLVVGGWMVQLIWRGIVSHLPPDPGRSGAGASRAPVGLSGFSDEVRPGFERTFQRRRWATVAVMGAGLLLWANAEFAWGFFGPAAGILAAVGMTVGTTVFFAIGPSPAEFRAYRELQRQGRLPGPGPGRRT